MWGLGFGVKGLMIGCKHLGFSVKGFQIGVWGVYAVEHDEIGVRVQCLGFSDWS